MNYGPINSYTIYVDLSNPFVTLQKNQHISKGIHEYFKNKTEKKWFSYILLIYIGTIIPSAAFGVLMIFEHQFFFIILSSILSIMTISCIIFVVIYRKYIYISISKANDWVLLVIFIYIITLTVSTMLFYEKIEALIFKENRMF